MPHYFFDIDDGENQTRDDEGVDLPHREAARKAAICALADVARDVLLDREQCDFTSVVRNETGDVVFRARLSLVAEWAGQSHTPR